MAYSRSSKVCCYTKVGHVPGATSPISSLRRHVRKALEDGKNFDLIDAHYVYPDGVAAAWLGVALGKPVIITARGTDLHLIANYRVPACLSRTHFPTVRP